MRNVALFSGAMLGLALIGSPASALTAVCGSPLTPGNADIVNVSTTECSLTLTSPSAGAYLEVSTAPINATTFDIQVNSGSTLNLSDAIQSDATNFALFFGAGTWTLGVFLPGSDPQSDFNFELTDTNSFTVDGSYSTTPLPAALPLFAGGLGMVGFLSRRRKRIAQGELAAA